MNNHLKPLIKWSGGKGDEINTKNIFQMTLIYMLNHLLVEVVYIST